MKNELLVYLTSKGVPLSTADEILDGAGGFLDLLDELLQSAIERNHAETLRAYVEAGTRLIAAEFEADFGVKLVGVALKMYESAAAAAAAAEAAEPVENAVPPPSA